MYRVPGFCDNYVKRGIFTAWKKTGNVTGKDGTQVCHSFSATPFFVGPTILTFSCRGEAR